MLNMKCGSLRLPGRSVEGMTCSISCTRPQNVVTSVAPARLVRLVARRMLGTRRSEKPIAIPAFFFLFCRSAHHSSGGRRPWRLRRPRTATQIRRLQDADLCEESRAKDRIHLKPTHFAYAQHLEAVEARSRRLLTDASTSGRSSGSSDGQDVQGALTHYELSGTYRTESPRLSGASVFKGFPSSLLPSRWRYASSGSAPWA